MCISHEELTELWEHSTKWRALDLMGARLTRVESINLETMEIFVEVELANCPEKIWWMEMDEKYGED